MYMKRCVVCGIANVLYNYVSACACTRLLGHGVNDDFFVGGRGSQSYYTY